MKFLNAVKGCFANANAQIKYNTAENNAVRTVDSVRKLAELSQSDKAYYDNNIAELQRQIEVLQSKQAKYAEMKSRHEAIYDAAGRDASERAWKAKETAENIISGNDSVKQGRSGFMALKDGMKDVVQSAKDDMSEVKSKASDWFASIRSGVSDLTASVSDKVKSVGSKSLDVARSGASKVRSGLAFVADSFKNACDTVKSRVVESSHELANKSSELVDKFKSNYYEASNKVLSGVSKFAERRIEKNTEKLASLSDFKHADVDDVHEISNASVSDDYSVDY